MKLGASLVLGVWSLVFSSRAQYSIDWSRIAGGGGTSTNAQFSLSGTIGQHDAGPTMAGSSFSLTGGFWSLLSVVQTPGAPILFLSLTATKTAVVSWSAPSTGYALQESPALANPNWTPVTNAVQTDGSLNWVIVPANTGIKFFRLRK